MAPDATNPHRAKCTPCGKCFDMVNMRESLLKGHIKSAKHSACMKRAAAGWMRRYFVASINVQPVHTLLQSPDGGSTCKINKLVTDEEIL